MNWTVIVMMVFVLGSCTFESPDERVEIVEVDEVPIAEVEKKGGKKERVKIKEFVSALDSLKTSVIDTSNLAGKRKHILRQYFLDNKVGYVGDTVFDLNYDQIDDFVIRSQGCCGSGLNYSARVYLFDKTSGSYKMDSTLSRLTNPSFFMDKGVITSFYLPYAAGSGKEYKWKNGEWELTKVVSVLNEGNSSVWEIDYPISKVKKELKIPYQMVPPKEVLTSNYKGNERN